MTTDPEYGRRWLDQHFPDWRRLLRMDAHPGATAQEVESAIIYALKASPVDMGARHLQFAWTLATEAIGAEPPHPNIPHEPADRDIALDLVREVIGDLLHYAKELPAAVSVTEADEEPGGGGIYLGLVALLVALLLLLSCATSESTVEEVDDRSSVSPVEARFVRRAEDLLVTLDGPPQGREQGVILLENVDGWESDWVVLTRSGQALLSVASNCNDDGDDVLEGDLWQLIDPGDLIEWDLAGDDGKVCTGEVRVVRKAAVE